MIDIGLEEALELKNCQSALKETLARLDSLGAGIAAIHVNAAIESLANNIAIRTTDSPSEFKLNCDSDIETSNTVH